MENNIDQAVLTDQNKISELQDKIALLENEKAELLAKLYWFEERFRLEQHKSYGRSSEQTMPDQQSIFNEAEILDAVRPVVPEMSVEITREIEIIPPQVKRISSCRRVLFCAYI